MKTPSKPTTLRLQDDTAAHLPLILPWGAARGRVAVETQKAMAASPVRRQLKEQAAQQYPHGKALARQIYFVEQRAIPGGVSAAPQDPAQLRKARAARGRIALAAARMAAPSFKAQAASGSGLWRELGPTLIPHGQTYGEGPGAKPSVSGRCCGILVDRNDPRHLVVCSAGGGLWNSQDGGATWAPLTDGMPTLRMGAIAQSPSVPAIAYAATGDGDGSIPYGIGVLRSSDGGKSWAVAPSQALNGHGSFDLAVDPADPLTLWVATDQGLYGSRNGGDTLRRVLDEMCWSVSPHPVNPGELLAAQAAGLMRSTDGGASWRRVDLPGTDASTRYARLEVCHAPGNGAIAYVAGCIDDDQEIPLLWRRATATGPFRALNAPSSLDASQAWYDWCLSVSPADPDTIFWGAIDLFRGRHAAGSMTWLNVSSKKTGDSIHPDQHALAFDPGDPNIVYACNDGGVYRSPDLGRSWASLNPGLGITEFEYIAQLASDSSWLFGGTQDNGSLTLAGSRRWDQVALGDGGDCAAVDRGKASICYHSYYAMPLEVADASGPKAFAWRDASPPVGKKYPALFYPPMDASETVVSKAGSTVWVSDDEGLNWVEISLPTSGQDPPDLATALNLLAGKAIFVGMRSGRLWRIDRGAAGWDAAVPTALGQLGNAYVSDMCIVGASAKTIWATSSRLGAPRVFVSSDAGKTFVNRTGNLPDVAVNAVTVDSSFPDTAYVGTDRGVYRTTDGGKHWDDISNGLPNAIVGCLVVHAASRTLRAGTRSRGAWELDLA